MPHESPWPILLALGLSLVFAMLVIEQFGVAGIVARAVRGSSLAGWHAWSREPCGRRRARRGRPIAWWGM